MTDDARERLGKLQHFAFDLVPDAAGYSSTPKQWTGKSTAGVVFESTVDEYTSVCVFQAVNGKSSIGIVATTADGDVFGWFFSVAVTEQNKFFSDPNMFVFSFEWHGRCTMPQQFAAKEEWEKFALVQFWQNSSECWFVRFGVYRVGCFLLGDERSISYCWDTSFAFEVLEDTTQTENKLCDEGPYRHCARLMPSSSDN